MAITNQERVGKALDLLKDGLQPFVERELKSAHADDWFKEAKASLSDSQSKLFGEERAPTWDVATILTVMWQQWNEVFRKTLGHADRSLVSELREVRNKWAHQNPFSGDDAYRALDSAARLLMSVSAPQADDVEKLKMELLRVRFDEQVRSEQRRTVRTAIESEASGALKPWREVATPHKDVASGNYQQAEFAADLWQVHLNEGADEYRNPAEFFRRTYLTESLKQLLTGGMRRLGAGGGDPVVQLQTNFGGGKTHSMLALYHLFSGEKPSALLGVDELMTGAEIKSLPKVNRVVLVGNKISPGNPSVKADGTVVRTLWGEMAWQLGLAAGGVKEAKKAFSSVAADDERATNPGDTLRTLFNTYSPCLILIDEWVAYARQLHDAADLPAGSFETHFTFAQALTEAAKLAKQCLLVISLPASDSASSPHLQADDIEVGGERGRAALARLQNVIGRLESAWVPASAEEGFEIVRRRLFEPMIEKTQFVARDTVARAFYELYRTQQQVFPPEAREPDYEKRLKAAYPIHPEVFDRLYGDWSTLVKFQRTRGVLRLMAAVIHSLWERGDKSPYILPANIPIDDHRVRDELTRYLPDNWKPIIETDVDGASSLPLRLDGDVPNLGKYSACRRVARTVFLGSAPKSGTANKGLEDRRVNLGCVMPGETHTAFGDALRRMSTTATFLYHDGARYWYSTQPTVTKVAEDRAEQMKRDVDAVTREIGKRLREDLRKPGDFSRVHVLPHSGQDVPDDVDARLVVLGTDHAYSKDKGNAAEAQAKEILESRGNSPRLYRNSLVFLAVDQARLQDLDEAVRRYLAWQSIVDEKEGLNLDPQQVKQAENQRDSANGVVAARLPEAYQWLLVPSQKKESPTIEWEALRLTGQDALAVRASKKLRTEEQLLTSFAGTRLRIDLDKIPLWRGNHVAVRQLAEDFARYLYLPRLVGSDVLFSAIRDGTRQLMWAQDSFAYADSFDEASGRYRGLQYGREAPVSADNVSGLLVKPETATRQIEEDAWLAAATSASNSAPGVATLAGAPSTSAVSPTSGPITPPPPVWRRYHGTVALDTTRVGRDAGRVAEEVISHLVGIAGADVKVTLDIEVQLPNGASDQVVRIVTENGRSLKFSSQGFEKE